MPRNQPSAMLLHFLGFLVMGIAFGFVGGLFGLGGGLIGIPMLGIFFGFPQQLAQGTALVLVIPTALVGLVQYLRRVKLNWRVVGVLCVTAFPLTIGGAHVATLIPSRALRFAFVAFLVLLALYIARRAWMLGRRKPRAPLPLPFATVVGVMSGAVSGLFSVGGSIFSVPLLTEFFAMSQTVAQATSVAFSVPGVLISIFVYARAGDVDWMVGIPLAIGGMSAASFGVAVAHRLPERTLRFLFVAFVLISAAALFVRATEL
jgi:uncharacterized protein